MSPKNPDDEAGKASGADFSSYRRQTMLDLRSCGITTEDIMSARIGISQKKVDKIKSQEAKKKEVVGRKNKYLKENSHSSFLQSSSSSLNPQVGLNSIMKKSHASPENARRKTRLCYVFCRNTKCAREIC